MQEVERTVAAVVGLDPRQMERMALVGKAPDEATARIMKRFYGALVLTDLLNEVRIVPHQHCPCLTNSGRS